MKACKDCGETKAMTNFYKHPGMSDGHLNSCKDCRRDYARRWYGVKMGDAEWVGRERARGRAKYHHAKTMGKYHRIRDPVKRAANVILCHAVRDGRVIPPSACEACNHDFSFYRREGHHPNYDLPLEASWLCSRCHGGLHKRYDK